MKTTVKGFMFYIAFVASLGGLLFGFDTAVISGAEKSIQAVYNLSDFAHGFTIATALIGTIIGALICGKPAEKYGRRWSLIVIAYLYLVSAIGSAVIVDWYSFMFFRFMGGLAVGASSVVGPMYIAEVSPSHWRGRFVAFFQFNIVLGIVIAYVANYNIVGIPHDWQWMLGVEAIPALLFGLLLMTVPESPRWLIKQNLVDKARLVLCKIGEPDVDREVKSIEESLEDTEVAGENLFQKKYFYPVLIAFLISSFNQLTGINAILYYAPRIFELSGVFREGAMMQSIVIGLTNLTFTMIGMLLIDKVGRKKLIGFGSIGMFLSLFLVARGFYLEKFEGYYMMLSLMGYIAFFAVSLGATIWVVISEVFPNSVRAKGQVFGSMTHWVWSALLSWFFPIFLSIGGTYIFGFFSVIALGSLVFAIKLPETRNKSLEQIQKELT
ncbi:sugar porter family MFS transporter [Parabacteroides chinchillae]